MTHQRLLYATFGWLIFAAVSHFFADVVSYHLRGQREPGPETTLYYGLHTSYALGQFVFGGLGLWLTRHHPAAFAAISVKTLLVVAAAGWLWISLALIAYKPPKVVAAVFAGLAVAAAVTTPRRPAETTFV